VVFLIATQGSNKRKKHRRNKGADYSKVTAVPKGKQERREILNGQNKDCRGTASVIKMGKRKQIGKIIKRWVSWGGGKTGQRGKAQIPKVHKPMGSRSVPNKKKKGVVEPPVPKPGPKPGGKAGVKG